VVVVVEDEVEPTGSPAALTACHVPPKLERPWPPAWPGPVSPLNSYRTQPLYVGYVEPPLEIVESSGALAPPPAVALDVPAGSGRGVHTEVQPFDDVHERFFVVADESS